MSYSFGQSFDPALPPPEPPPPPSPGDFVAPPPAANGDGYKAKAKAWWNERSDIEKVAVIAGGMTLLGLTAYAITSGPRVRVEAPRQAYRPNSDDSLGRHSKSLQLDEASLRRAIADYDSADPETRSDLQAALRAYQGAYGGDRQLIARARKKLGYKANSRRLPGTTERAEENLREALAIYRAESRGSAQDRREARNYLQWHLETYEARGGTNEALIERAQEIVRYKPKARKTNRRRSR